MLTLVTFVIAGAHNFFFVWNGPLLQSVLTPEPGLGVPDIGLGDAMPDPARFLRTRVAEGIEAHHVTQGVALPGQIATADDLVCFEQSEAEPNFVTALSVQAPQIYMTQVPLPLSA